MELRLEENVLWDVAAVLLYHLSQNIRTWRDYVSETYFQERLRNLTRYELMPHIGRKLLAAADLNAYVYILDRCCGIADRDWGWPRLYCDGHLTQLVAK